MNATFFQNATNFTIGSINTNQCAQDLYYYHRAERRQRRDEGARNATGPSSTSPSSTPPARSGSSHRDRHRSARRSSENAGSEFRGEHWPFSTEEYNNLQNLRNAGRDVHRQSNTTQSSRHGHNSVTSISIVNGVTRVNGRVVPSCSSCRDPAQPESPSTVSRGAEPGPPERTLDRHDDRDSTSSDSDFDDHDHGHGHANCYEQTHSRQPGSSCPHTRPEEQPSQTTLRERAQPARRHTFDVSHDRNAASMNYTGAPWNTIMDSTPPPYEPTTSSSGKGYTPKDTGIEHSGGLEPSTDSDDSLQATLSVTVDKPARKKSVLSRLGDLLLGTSRRRG